MPELPDLHVFSRNLDRELKGKTLQKIEVNKSERLNVSITELNKNLQESTVKKVFREGKQLHFLFDNVNVLGIHLMLHGKLYLFEKTNLQKNTIASLLFDDYTGLVLTDFRGMAHLIFNPEQSDAPDALSEKLSPAFFKQTLAASGKKIKDILLDQHIIRGIGNAYADEILWYARISPFSIAKKIPAEKVTMLAKAIEKVLEDAEKKYTEA